MTEEKEGKEVVEKIETKPEIPKKIGPPRGGLMKRTLKELEMLGIQFKDVFSKEKMTINLSWTKVICLVNYNAEEDVLGWDHTFTEALQIIGIFLF